MHRIFRVLPIGDRREFGNVSHYRLVACQKDAGIEQCFAFAACFPLGGGWAQAKLRIFGVAPSNGGGRRPRGRRQADTGVIRSLQL